MSMTATEMIDFFGQQVARTRFGMKAAQSSSNYQLAAMNSRQAFKCRLMQGLICWRLSNDPTQFLVSSVKGLEDDWRSLVAIGGDKAKLVDVPAERMPFILCLIGLSNGSVDCETDGLESDRLLDAVLGQWLLDGSWKELLWKTGIDQLHRTGRKLAYESYSTYAAIAKSSSTEIITLFEICTVLFKSLEPNKLFCGGDQTEGGGNDNALVVDYRLASLAKRIGYKGTSTNEWQW